MGRAFVLSLGEITILSAALIGFGYFAGSSRFRAATPSTAALSSASTSKTGATEQQAFVLLVNLKFTTLEHRDTFLQLIDPVCKDVQANEGPLNKQQSPTVGLPSSSSLS